MPAPPHVPMPLRYVPVPSSGNFAVLPRAADGRRMGCPGNAGRGSADGEAEGYHGWFAVLADHGGVLRIVLVHQWELSLMAA
jgi:hypothetical protein